MNDFANMARIDAANRAAMGHGSAASSVKSFEFVAVGDLEYREPEFVVDGLIETDGVGMIFGDPGCGKSFIAADLGLCVASGSKFHGRAVKQGPVLFIAGEGHNGLARRFAAWSKERGISLTHVPMFKSERAAQFLDGASARAVADAADQLANVHGAPRLIIIDTVARNFGAGDENSTQDMTNFIVAIDDLKERYPGSVVLLIHHSGHGDKGRARGAIALKGALDFEYRIEKDGSRLDVVNTKMKDAPPPDDLHFTLESVHLCGDATSAVLRQAAAPSRRDRRTPMQTLALATYIDAAHGNGLWTGEGGSFRGVHVDHWRDAFYAKHTGDSSAAKRKAFHRVRTELVNSGTMDVESDVYLVADQASLSTIFETIPIRSEVGVTSVT